MNNTLSFPLSGLFFISRPPSVGGWTGGSPTQEPRRPTRPRPRAHARRRRRAIPEGRHLPPPTGSDHPAGTGGRRRHRERPGRAAPLPGERGSDQGHHAVHQQPGGER